MAFLTSNELPTYYPEAANMDAAQVTKYLNRANSYCYGVIGGSPPTIDGNLKTVVAMAFEILAEGEVAQTDPVTGNITDAAPVSPYNRFDKNANPLATVDKMLMPYKRAFESANEDQADNGVSWLGRC
jgi:hypothetical protein